MPPPDEVLNEAEECLGSLRVIRFSADRTKINAGEFATLQWEIDASECRAGVGQIEINNSRVPLSGSRRVSPIRDIVYRLDARAAGLFRSLGRVGIAVDDSGCVPELIPESSVATLLLGGIRVEIETYNNAPKFGYEMKERRDTVVEIDTAGVLVGLRLELEIPNFPNPKIDVDAKIGIGLSAEGKTLAFYKSFSVDVHWPSWLTGVGAAVGGAGTVGIVQLAESVVGHFVSGHLKSTMLDGLTKGIDGIVNLNPTRIAAALVTSQDNIIATYCSK